MKPGCRKRHALSAADLPILVDGKNTSWSDGNAARTVYEVKKSVASQAMGSKDTNDLKNSCGRQFGAGR